MTHGSLFSGIGGFDLAAEWMGWENKFHCEWNQFGQKVLKYYWPEAESFEDITKTDFTKYANTISVLTGGFPCQPYSLAGKRKGKEDDRHLWPEMLRAIREIKPRWVVGENVRGLTNWNGGLVFDEVCTDLENLGYQVTTYLIPACGVGAPHKRERIWIVASNTKCIRLEYGTKAGNIREGKGKAQSKRSKSSSSFEANSINGDATNSDCTPSQFWYRQTTEKREKQSRRIESICEHSNWQTFPTVSPICNGDDGISDRLDSITFSKWRNESIKAGGNAIVPQVVYQIFKSIEIYDRNH